MNFFRFINEIYSDAANTLIKDFEEQLVYGKSFDKYDRTEKLVKPVTLYLH